jgi:hypothetical protein
MTTTNQQEIYRAKVNLETARIEWRELQRFFASGVAIFVSDELDLVEVAFQISQDNKLEVESWLQAGQVARVTDAQALSWHAADAEMWAVVVSPYVLVQPVHQIQ